MSLIEKVAKIDSKLRPLITQMPPKFVINMYSIGRKEFLFHLINSNINARIKTNPDYKTRLWDMEFNLPLFNAAGMFKNGEGYNFVCNQGAGAFLAGTSTFTERKGNIKYGISHPFAPFPNSNSAINWMGLPNEGHFKIASKLAKVEKQKGCPLGISISSDPAQHGDEALYGTLIGLETFEKANVDFIELNESCPNVPHDTGEKDSSGLDSELVKRILYLKDRFLKDRTRNLPVIVKLSNDTDIDLLPNMIDLLIESGFDGINFGNTSTRYSDKIHNINDKDKKLFEYFTSNFGGGLSGEVLKDDSLKLSKLALNHIRTKNLHKEFNVIRTGGVIDFNDVKTTLENGIQINQWFTGYFESFSKYGNKLYKELFNVL